MSKVEDKVKKIRDEIIGVTSKRVLLVEGPDDVKAFTQLLNRKRPGWELTWAVVDAGNKKIALEMAALAPDWLALVDRDEWTADEIEIYQTEYVNLFILPRFCLESYLIDPAELWLALPPVRQVFYTAACMQKISIRRWYTRHWIGCWGKNRQRRAASVFLRHSRCPRILIPCGPECSNPYRPL